MPPPPAALPAPTCSCSLTSEKPWPPNTCNAAGRRAGTLTRSTRQPVQGMCRAWEPTRGACRARRDQAPRATCTPVVGAGRWCSTRTCGTAPCLQASDPCSNAACPPVLLRCPGADASQGCLLPGAPARCRQKWGRGYRWTERFEGGGGSWLRGAASADGNPAVDQQQQQQRQPCSGPYLSSMKRASSASTAAAMAPSCSSSRRNSAGGQQREQGSWAGGAAGP